ncbi:hypothetical protein Desor_0880 [Desulfosporosinus orientis DSM 765]|uniref:Uncharacterized protein n=1 Tax=Desulfosporosinus orientis (strain ATCC 19365 / DSM 765 / NCIMB 8382 / VKM B-1628 / Singapore I) TaxID=768706 RepID=G7WCM2_DESOD|nr:hypothetical protein [Desulfosporosinus orientis]AET66560.1 hypothetical protein Desor_0880 [Desulfosporosinus orientis DSM 765]
MGEKNIIAYFKSPEDARKVQEQIKSLGVNDIQIDRFHKYPLGSADQLSSPGTAEMTSQATLTLGASEGRDTGVLASADVSASGMSDGDQNPISGRDIVLAAIVDESVFDQAIQFVKDGDGSV